MKRIIVCSLLLLCGNLWAKTLTPYQAVYTVKSFGITVGKATRELTFTPDGHYHLKMHSWSTSPLLNMDVTQSSEGIYATNQPLHYEFLQKRGSDIRQNIIDFDWKKAIATSRYKGSVYQLPLQANTQDKISYQLQLQNGASMGEKDFIYLIADEKKTDTYQFHSDGHERITTNNGDKIDTVKFSKDDDKSKRSTEIWLAPQYNFVVVKLTHTEHGVTTTLLLTDYKSTYHPL